MPNPHRLLTTALLAALTLFVGVGCDRQGDNGEAQGEVYTYRVRGQVVSVDGHDVQVHHEAIPEFVHMSGEADGMEEMVMPLTLAPDIDPSSIEPGDRISFSLHVRWEPRADSWIDNITPLPEDAELNINTNDTPEAEDDGHDHSHDHHDHAH